MSPAAGRRRLGRDLGRTARLVRSAGVVLATVLWPSDGRTQTFEHRGFAEVTLAGYPRTTPTDRTRGVAETLLRWDATWRFGDWKIDGSLDARFDSHDMTERRVRLRYWDRTLERPVLSLRRLSASWARPHVTVDVGKQFVRWGKTDIVIPTDRFAPRDYVNASNSDVLAVTAARVVVANSTDSLDVVFTPRMTPTRMPLLGQRWLVLPPASAGIEIVDGGARPPPGSQVGVRWNHVGRYVEHSVSVFRGFNHLPLVAVTPTAPPVRVGLHREYARLTAVGGDVAVPLPWFTLKAESAWLGSDSPAADEIVLSVVQLERQVGEWLLIGGYVAEHVIRERPGYRFAPDRGLARALMGRASFTIDTNRTFVVESVVRQDASGVYGKAEYSQAFGPHWRVTAQGVVFRGAADDYLGQYRPNSFGGLTLRFSF